MMIKQSSIATIGAALILAAPLLFGCLPPWASGFLLAGVCVLGAALIIVSVIYNYDWLPLPFGLRVTLYLLLTWLVATVLYDVIMGAECGRAPALSLRKFGYLGAFFAALGLGAIYAQSAQKLKWLLFGMTCLGLILSCFALAQYYGWDVKTLLDSSSSQIDQKHICGLYTNFNRFAALLAVCWICACGLLLYRINQHRYLLLVFEPKTIVLCAAVLVMTICIGLSRSRIAILAMSISLGIATLCWWRLRALDNRRDYRHLMSDSAIGKILKIAPFVFLALLGTWGFLIDVDDSRVSLAVSLSREIWSGEMRSAALGAAWQMFLHNPLGYGIGAFETFFAQVRPTILPNSWHDLHCDWLQWTLEAGAPALLLGLAALALWCRACWIIMKKEKREVENEERETRNEKRETRNKGTRDIRIAILFQQIDSRVLCLKLLPCVGALALLWCSAVDFPLREPASALLFCFLVGALCHTAGQSQEKSSQQMVWRFAPLALVPIFLCGAWFSARNSAAYACSPWMWRIACPQPRGEDLSAWQAALRIDSGDPELLFHAGMSAAAANNKENLSQAREYLCQAMRQQPFDYRFFLNAGIIAERDGQLDEALRLRAQAVALAPNNLTLREENARLYLQKRAVLPLNDIANRHDLAMLAIAELSQALAGQPHQARKYIKILDEANCLNNEIVELWPSSASASCLRRARFFLERHLWHLIDDELRQLDPTDADATRWQHAIRGTLALKRDLVNEGLAELQQAVTDDAPRSPELSGWLSEQASTLSPDICKMLVEGLFNRLPVYPQFTLVLARRLMDSNHWLLAHQLLEKTMMKSIDLGALYAELALRLGDISAASQRADEVWRRSHGAPAWARWYDNFCLRLKQREERMLTKRKG